jgi:hypothetical protein
MLLLRAWLPAGFLEVFWYDGFEEGISSGLKESLVDFITVYLVTEYVIFNLRRVHLRQLAVFEFGESFLVDFLLHPDALSGKKLLEELDRRLLD